MKNSMGNFKKILFVHSCIFQIQISFLTSVHYIYDSVNEYLQSIRISAPIVNSQVCILTVAVLTLL
jgi:hypothetical protein